MSNFTEFVALKVHEALLSDGAMAWRAEEAAQVTFQALERDPSVDTLSLYSVRDSNGRHHVLAAPGDVHRDKQLLCLDVRGLYRAARCAEQDYLSIVTAIGSEGTEI